MQSDAVVEQIVAIIRDVRRNAPTPVEIGASTQIDSLGIDSLDFVEMLFSIEERFDIDIEFNANTDGGFPFQTVGNAADAVRALIAAKGLAA